MNSKVKTGLSIVVPAIASGGVYYLLPYIVPGFFDEKEWWRSVLFGIYMGVIFAIIRYIEHKQKKRREAEK